MQVDLSGDRTMGGRKWLLVLPLLVDLNLVISHPLTGGSHHLDYSECCPCPGARSPGEPPADWTPHCPCQRDDDAEGSASFLTPALRAMRPFVEQPNHKNEPKPLLQPEVGLASSVLETLREATDEEYQDALARDAAKSAVQLLESTLDPFDDALLEAPKNKVTIFLNREGDDMDDNLPEPSHIQETRCIHSPLRSSHKLGPLRVSRPSPIVEVIELSPKPTRRLNNKGLLHRKMVDMDNSIGASNIKERVVKPNSDHNLEHANLKSNPSLLSLFPRNMEKMDGESNRDVIPKVHLKLRELIDNLDIRKSKVPIIDLKKNIPVSQSNTLKIPKEKSILSHDNKPLLLKNILKLKDVELIPRHSILKSTNSKQPYPTLKSKSGSSENCNEVNNNFMHLINQDVEITNDQFDSDVEEPETSPTNSNSVFDLKNNEVDWNTKQSFISNGNVANSENNGLSSTSSVPEDFEGQDNFDYGEMKGDEDTHEEQLLSDNCNGASNSFMQNSVNNKDLDEGFNNDDLEKGQIQKLDNNDVVNRDGSDEETFQTEFIEDFDTPIEFDNSSFIPSSNLNNNDESMLNDPITDSSNVLETRNQNPDMPQKNGDKIAVDCNSLESNSNFISEKQSSVAENSMQQDSSEDDTSIDIAREPSPDINENSNQIKLKDLQDMSDSILRLSECVTPSIENINIKSNSDEDLEHINNDYDMENTASSTLKFETNSKETETGDNFDMQSTINANTKSSEESDVDINEKSCQPNFSELPSDIDQTDINDSINFDVVNTEMRAEASDPQPKSVFTKSSKDFSKHSDFLNNIKLKLDGLFSTTENTNELFKHSDDNVNESSNVNPIVALSDKLQRTPQTLLRKISLPELPRMSLDPFNSQPLANSLNLLNFPRQLGDSSDASLAFTALSDNIRSHTENTIQNVKETLESTLRNSQSFPLSRPTDIFAAPDILESMSNKRDDIKEKLEAIHYDLNDRLSSFQQNILEHLNVPPAEHFKFHRGGNNAWSSSLPEIPFPAASKLDEVKHENPLFPLRASAPKSGKFTKINITPSKFPSSSDAPPIRKSERKLQSTSSHTTTTPIPSFIPRPKVLKTNIGSTPKVPSEIFLKARPSKLTVPKEKLQKIKPPSLQNEKTRNLSEEPFSPSTLSSRMNLPVKAFKTNKEKINKDLFSIQSPVDTFKKKLFQKNQKDRRPSNVIGNDGYSSNTQESYSSRPREGRTRTGSRNNDGMVESPSTHQESGLRLVEPLKENVPYKCKLICYKDS